MEYFRPKELTQEEINFKIKRVDLTDAERESLVISALYYTPTEFAGDLLLQEFKKVE